MSILYENFLLSLQYPPRINPKIPKILLYPKPSSMCSCLANGVRTQMCSFEAEGLHTVPVPGSFRICSWALWLLLLTPLTQGLSLFSSWESLWQSWLSSHTCLHIPAVLLMGRVTMDTVIKHSESYFSLSLKWNWFFHYKTVVKTKWDL